MAATTTKKAPPKYPCNRCGKRSIAEQMIYSAFTGNRYCATDFDACERRARRAR